MSGIKGLVLLTRLDFIEKKYGRQELKAFIDALNLGKRSRLNQPVSFSKDYSEQILMQIDESILSRYFDNDVLKFREMGLWNAEKMVSKYFQVYVDENKPAGFLKQFAAMRDILIGLGEMKVVTLEESSYMFRINYGQPFLESVKQSELGFIEGGLQRCSAQNVRLSEEESSDIAVEYKVSWNS